MLGELVQFVEASLAGGKTPIRFEEMMVDMIKGLSSWLLCVVPSLSLSVTLYFLTRSWRRCCRSVAVHSGQGLPSGGRA
jgi:hypothetical protein